jgi:PBP1b-binding outer membrane lipoprotein LpoB
MTHRGFAITNAIGALALLCASCAPAWVPVVGKSPDVQIQSVRSIKTIHIQRIAILPPIETPSPGSSVADGASDSMTAELQAKMAIEAGWQMVPESDVSDALEKMPPTTEANLQQNAIELGHKVNADAVMYGKIETYKERVGSDYAAASPASVAFTLHLIDVQNGQIIWSSRFQKSQKSLSENVFDVVSFIQNSGRWVRAHEIAAEGVDQSVEDLHNKLNLVQQGPAFQIPQYQGRYDNTDNTQ